MLREWGVRKGWGGRVKIHCFSDIFSNGSLTFSTRTYLKMAELTI